MDPWAHDEDFEDVTRPGVLGFHAATMGMRAVLSTRDSGKWETWLRGENRPGYGSEIEGGEDLTHGL